MPQIAIGIGLSVVSTVIASRAQAKKSKRLTALAEERASLESKHRELEKKTKLESYARDRRARIAAMHRGFSTRGLDPESTALQTATQNIESSFEGAESILEQSHSIQNKIGAKTTEISTVEAQGPGLATSILSSAAGVASAGYIQSGINDSELSL